MVMTKAEHRAYSLRYYRRNKARLNAAKRAKRNQPASTVEPDHKAWLKWRDSHVLTCKDFPEAHCEHTPHPSILWFKGMPDGKTAYVCTFVLRRCWEKFGYANNPIYADEWKARMRGDKQ